MFGQIFPGCEITQKVMRPCFEFLTPDLLIIAPSGNAFAEES
jgi:hypothetical protein